MGRYLLGATNRIDKYRLDLLEDEYGKLEGTPLEPLVQPATCRYDDQGRISSDDCEAMLPELEALLERLGGEPELSPGDSETAASWVARLIENCKFAIEHHVTLETH